MVGHITPEAQTGGLIALVQNGDWITIDAVNNRLEARLDEEEIKRRKMAWVEPPLPTSSGLLFKYARFVASASKGCVTDE